MNGSSFSGTMKEPGDVIELLHGVCAYVRLEITLAAG